MAEPRVYIPERSFSSAPTLWRMLNSTAFVKGVVGPFGSGKSTLCTCALGANGMQQRPNKFGVRRSRYAVIRNTYPELISTTIATWQQIYRPESCGPVVFSKPIRHRIKHPAVGFEWRGESLFVGAPGFEMEILFMALDKAEDISKLKSLDLTGAWINEAVEVPYEILDVLLGRVGRFPAEDEEGCTYPFVLLDTNAGDEQNWYHKMADKGEGKTDLSHLDLKDRFGKKIDLSWEFFRQPPAVLECRPHKDRTFIVREPGFAPFVVKHSSVIEAAGKFWTVNPMAENASMLRAGYYQQQVANKTLAAIQRYLQCKTVYWIDGKAWVPEYDDNAMARELPYSAQLPLKGGIDIGGGTLNPSAVLGQTGSFGDQRILSELVRFDMGIDEFSTLVRQWVAAEFPGVAFDSIVWTLDPAAAKRDEVFKVAVDRHLRARGFNVQLAETNDPSARREALAMPMTRLVRVAETGVLPAFMVHKRCVKLREALSGKWHLKRSREGLIATTPVKNEWSHVGDAASYFTMGAGEYARLTRPVNSAGLLPATGGTVVMRHDFEV